MGGPYSKDYSILGCIFGGPLFREITNLGQLGLIHGLRFRVKGRVEEIYMQGSYGASSSSRGELLDQNPTSYLEGQGGLGSRLIEFITRVVTLIFPINY